MASASVRGWGSGWPNCQKDMIRTIVRPDGVRVGCRLDILEMTAILMDLTELKGYDLVPGETWGFSCRAVAGTQVASNHSWGLAFDLNSTRNPYASVAWHAAHATDHRPFGLAVLTDIPQDVIEMWESQGFYWGGRYRTKPDTMHFEYLQTPADAKEQTKKLKDFLGLPPNVPYLPGVPDFTPAPSPVPIGKLLWPLLSTKTRSKYPTHTRIVQQVSGTKVDGDYYTNTANAVKGYQKALGFSADGQTGQQTGTGIVQNVLRDNGYGNLELDGDYGRATTDAVVKFQNAYGLQADGMFGDESTQTMWVMMGSP